MATITPKRSGSSDDFEKRASYAPSAQPRWQPAFRRWAITGAIVLACGAGLAAVVNSSLWPGDAPARGNLTHTVARSNLLVTVTEDGNLESASNVDVKCEVAGGSTILWIVKDGTQVSKGDELVKLDSSAIEDQVNLQKIAFEKARAAHIEAEKQFSAAKIAVQEYVEGTYLKDLQDLESKITVALENLRSSENSFQHTQRMARKGYVTSLQRDAQAFAVERAKLDLASARTAKNVLVKFTRAKTVEDLESKRDTAAARMRSEKASFELEEARLKRLMLQVEKCVIKAPADGMVIYANEPGGRFGQQGAQIEEGAAVRERQTMIRLPNLNDMQVKAKVHESKIELLRTGLPARIRLQGKDYKGSVSSVANQAESSSWFMGNVKEYAVVVKIEGSSAEWKPGMTAAVEILVARLDNVLNVPVQAVVEIGGEHFCWVDAGSPPQRKVELGMENNTSVEIKSGLREGERVLLNPRKFVANLPANKKEAAASDGATGRFSAADKVAPPGGAVQPDASQLKPAAAAGEPGAGDAGSRRGRDLMKYDSNGDKKISRDEAPEQAQQLFDMADLDHDGFIDAKEIAAMRKAFQQNGGRGGAGPPAGPAP